MPQDLAIALDWHISTALSYFGAPFHPNTWNTVYGIIPGLGMLALLLGITTGLRKRATVLWWFALPVLLLHLFLIPLSDMHLILAPAAPWLLGALLIAEIVVFIYAWRRSSTTFGPVAALTFFDLTYILMAAFWAGMRHMNGPPAPAIYRVFS